MNNKNLVPVILIALISSNLAAQNVGIGTTTPVNKLSVNGSANFTDKVGIGTETPAGELDVKSQFTGIESVDQNAPQAGFFYGLGYTSEWQSFTAGGTGLLTRVGLRVKSPLGSTASPGTIRIYMGEGTGGVLLATIPVTYQPITSSTFQDFPIAGVSVTSGLKYTIQLSAPVVTNNWIYASAANTYPGGHAGHDLSETIPAANGDISFHTFLLPTATIDALVINNGNVSIGTSSHAARLRISAEGSTFPALSISGQGEIQVDSSGVVGGRLTIKNNGDAGIGTATPVTKLDVNGGIRTKYSGTVVFDGIAGGVRALNITIPAVPAGWDMNNTIVSVTNTDGVDGTIRQARLTSLTNIEVKYIQDASGLVRFNWIIFKL